MQCALAKHYAVTLEKRISSFVENSCLRAPMQAGFRKAVGTQHNCFVLKHLQARYYHPLEKTAKACFVCLEDFAKAFDKANRQLIWHRLHVLGLDGRLLEALKYLYMQVKLCVRVNGKLGDEFESLLGVKQSDSLSPALFGVLIGVLPEWFNLWNSVLDPGLFDDRPCADGFLCSLACFSLTTCPPFLAPHWGACSAFLLTACFLQSGPAWSMSARQKL